MPIGIGETARIAARMNFAGVADIVNVYWAENLSGGIVSDANILIDAGALMEILMNQINANLSNLMTYEDISVSNISTGSPIGVAPWPVLTVGGSASDAIPTQVAALVIGRTSFARVQGRKYLGLFVETSKVGSAWSVGVLTALANFATQWETSQIVNGRTYEFGVWRPSLASLVTFRNTAVLADARTQRRRTPGRGS